MDQQVREWVRKKKMEIESSGTESIEHDEPALQASEDAVPRSGESSIQSAKQETIAELPKDSEVLNQEPAPKENLEAKDMQFGREEKIIPQTIPPTQVQFTMMKTEASPKKSFLSKGLRLLLVVIAIQVTFFLFFYFYILPMIS